MPGAHRHGDNRFCGATTIVSNQSTVFVEDKLWAVQGDQNTHINGNLVAKYGSLDVYNEDILVIVAVGDEAVPDWFGHPKGPVNPSGRSSTVFSYD